MPEPDGDRWRDNVSLRSFLRTHPEAASAYGSLKTQAARDHPRLLAYWNAKAALLQDLLGRETPYHDPCRERTRAADMIKVGPDRCPEPVVGEPWSSCASSCRSTFLYWTETRCLGGLFSRGPGRRAGTVRHGALVHTAAGGGHLPA